MRTSPLLLLLAALALTSCASRSSKFREIRGYAQGTTYSIVYFDPDRRDFSPQFDSLLQEVDQSMSTYLENSLISQFNRARRGIRVDGLFKTVFTRSREIAEESGGLFDPTVENLVSGWGFGSGAVETMTPERVRELLQITGMQHVRLEGDSLIKDDPRVKLTFNAIAQGYSVDLIAAYLESQGVWDYLVEIGGETRVKGKNPDGALWRIGIEKPEATLDDKPFQAICALDNTSLVTSGNYRKFRVDSLTGMKYSHTINPLTGYPVRQNLLSASVLHPSAMDADGYATLLMVLGMEKSIEFLQKKQMDGFLIYSDSAGMIRTWTTPGFKATLQDISGS